MTSKDFMCELADMIDEEYEKEYMEFEELGKNFPPELDEKLLAMAKKLDEDYKKKHRKTKSLMVLKKVAVYLLVFASVNMVAVSTSEAYRVFLFGEQLDKEAGGLILTTEEANDVINEWSGYYYPEYLPKGYVISAAEYTGGEKCLMIKKDDNYFLISTMSKSMQISIDTEHTKITEIKIKNSVAKRVEHEGGIFIIYPTDKAIVEVRFDGSIDEKEIIKVAENLKYIEN